jgi:hypothetical protein
MGPSGKGTAATWHVKGNLFLTGDQWSTQKNDDRGHPSGWAWRFDFNEGRSFKGESRSTQTSAPCVCAVPDNDVCIFRMVVVAVVSPPIRQ